jgi:hypothetical protein
MRASQQRLPNVCGTVLFESYREDMKDSLCLKSRSRGLAENF